MLIGTHNSASYNINWNINFWNFKSKWYWLRLFGKYIKPIRTMVENYTKCQSLSIEKQLEIGVQVLDLRISYSDKYYVSHTFCCLPYEDVLSQISRSEKKPIIIFIKPDFETSFTLKGKEEGLIEETMKWLGSFNIQIYYEPIDIYLKPEDKIIDSKYIQKLWFNTDSLDDFIARFNETRFYGKIGLDCILTPHKVQNISIRDYADHLNSLVLYLLKYRADKPAFCMFDFVEIHIIN